MTANRVDNEVLEFKRTSLDERPVNRALGAEEYRIEMIRDGYL